LVTYVTKGDGRSLAIWIAWRYREDRQQQHRASQRVVPGVPRMTLVNIVVILVVVGLVMWLINTYIPMAGAIKSLLNIVVFVVVLVWVLQVFGVMGPIPGVHFPALH
jgi:hypothetical protein